MKKNFAITQKIQPKSVHTVVGLFASQQSRQHVLQDLKRGTLFHLSPKTHPKQQTKRLPTQQDNRCWINDIVLGRDQRIKQLYQQDQEIVKTTNKPQKHLPNLKRSKINKENLTSTPQRSCSKIICFQKKLSRQGAWNQQNSNNIAQNVLKLQQSLYLNPKQLTHNDFYRVRGLNFKHKSIEDSINDSTYTISDESNIFQKISMYSTAYEEKACFVEGNPENKKRKKLAISTGHFIPPFLIKYLMINDDKLPKI